MNICIPVTADDGLASHVNPHFGSTPVFLVVDTETGACRSIPNRNQHHAHGMCQPLVSLQGQSLDAIVVGGIGMGALTKLLAAGLTVYQADRPTAGEVVEAFRAGLLVEFTPGMACAHHGQHAAPGAHAHGSPGHDPQGQGPRGL